MCKHFLHISCAHKPYVVTRNFVVDCLEHENLKKNLGDVRFGVTLDMPNFLFKNLDGTMERGDKVLKNGIFAISTGQKLTEILQVNFFYFSAIYAKNVRSGRGWLKNFCSRSRVN